MGHSALPETGVGPREQESAATHIRGGQVHSISGQVERKEILLSFKLGRNSKWVNGIKVIMIKIKHRGRALWLMICFND